MIARAIVNEWQKKVAPLQEELLTADELAALLKVSPSWVRHHSDDFPHIKVGGVVRFPRSKVMTQIMV